MTTAYRFGRFELAPATRQLAVDGQPVALGSRAFDLLLTLVERRDRLVAKNELLELVWPGLVVEENNIQVHISALRKVLGQHAIATVAGHGYRFTLEMTEATTEAAAPSAPKRHLPVPLASFIGRERELTDLRAMLTRHRLVTLTGVGGIGKTRLALELATLVADVYADGVWFVDLAPVSDAGLVVNAVASSLGVREEAGRPVIESLQAFVASRALLLVLDNCEHLLHACGQLARDLLQSGLGIVIVATSREPLHVSGEATYPVPPMPVPRDDTSLDALGANAAVRLFVDRATAARPDFALAQQNAAAIARICRDLDGIPLALELAAARVRTMSVAAIVEHLTDRFALLKGGDPTALPRQQTLRATFDWSYELLEPQERALLRRLSVFAGGLALDAAEAVGAGDDLTSGDVLDALGHLVDKSLVAFDAEDERYKLLETVREYALERLAASGEEARSRDRHLAFYTSLAERARPDINGSKQATWAARLDAERANIQLAFAHARHAAGGARAALEMVHGLYMWLTWRDAELWHRLTLEALERPEAQQEDMARSRALYVAAFIAYLTGRYEEAFGLAQSSVRIARACDDPLALGEGLYSLGIASIAVDRQDEARENFIEGLALARRMGQRTLIANLSCGLGELHSQRGQFELAEPPYLEALAHSLGDPTACVIALLNLARNAIALRDEAKAVQFLRQAVATADAQNSFSDLSFLMNCAGIAALHEEWALALRLSGAAQAHQERQSLWGDFVDAPFHARHAALAREALGDLAADTALAVGRAVSIDAILQETEAWLLSLSTA